MSHPSAPIPLRAARALALHAQRLGDPHYPDGPQPTRRDILGVVEQLGAIQIDTLQMVHRSHYLTLWSRLGMYDPADVDALAYGSPTDRDDRQLFEYWFHAACLIPLREYRYTLPHKRRNREKPDSWHHDWLATPEAQAVLAHVQARIREQGAVRAADFEHDGQRSGSWWGWRPAKRALEILFSEGTLMVADRINFQRVYDLTERVLPDWVDTSEPTLEETRRFLMSRAVRVFGLCEPLQAANYVHMKRSTARPYVESLLKAGELQEVDVDLADGRTTTMVLHRENLPLLEAVLDGALAARRTTFLSPFDSLFWPQGRDRQLWGFEQTLEAYKPAPQRSWGYFCLPILHEDRLVGRFDPRLERRSGTLTLRALYLEPGIALEDSLIADVAVAMRDFLRFHSARNLVIERSDPPAFGERLLAVL